MSTVKNHTLKTKDLSIGYKSGKGQIMILENLNLELRAGQLICFMGPNGIGKSTLLRTLCKVQPGLKGEITIAGENIMSIKPGKMAQLISLVLTDKVNAGNLTVQELVALGRYPYLGWSISFNDEDEKLINNAMDQAGVSSYSHKKVGELSDGQLQKAMIARALCQDTPILILDEPTAHLDLNNRISIINLLKKLARESGKAVLMATHELDLALQVADKLWLAGRSGIIEEGIPEDLVLNGSIDRVFELKGYDLKTGKLVHTSYNQNIALEGEGYLFLWTKNALERNGFNIDESAKNHILVKASDDKNMWVFNGKDCYQSITDLMEGLEKF